MDLFENDSDNNRRNDDADLPWFTEVDLDETRKDLEFFQQHKDPHHMTSTYQKKLWFRPAVLDRYKNHQYCILDVSNPFNCLLAFLDYERKQVVSSISFEIHHGTILMVSLDSFLSIPPRERKIHWQRYHISDDLRSYK